MYSQIQFSPTHPDNKEIAALGLLSNFLGQLLTHSIRHAQYFALINLNLKPHCCAKVSFSLLLILHKHWIHVHSLLLQTQVGLQWGPSLHRLPAHSQLHAAEEHHGLCEVTILQLLRLDRSVFCSAQLKISFSLLLLIEGGRTLLAIQVVSAVEPQSLFIGRSRCHPILKAIAARPRQFGSGACETLFKPLHNYFHQCSGEKIHCLHVCHLTFRILNMRF